MTQFEHSDTFLAKWLSNDISQKQREAFENCEDYELYSKIAEASEGFIRPQLDRDVTYQKIVEAIEIKKTEKVKPLFYKWIGAIAASIALLFGGLYFLQSNSSITSNFGEQLTVKLPDASEVILNSNSKLSYNENKWKNDRSLTLEGEAYFKVSKGSTFTVKTSEGHITVLGTEFNVFQGEDFLLVKCFEGTVKVVSNNNVAILTKGKSFKYFNGVTFDEKDGFEETKPSWINGESVFNSVPLKMVFKSLENQYNITINNGVIDESKSFTGSFIHSDLFKALESVLLPMNIQYELSEKTKEVILKHPSNE